MQVRRQIVLKKGSWPSNVICEYHNGQTWVNVGWCGPGYADVNLEYAGSFYAISATKNGSNTGPVGSVISLSAGPAIRDLQMKFGGVLYIANCESAVFTWSITKTSGASSGSMTMTETPPVYIHYGATGEGGGGPMVDNGNLPDLDNDGIPDNEDPDDDGDGRPDEDDAFPRDPNEKDDTDGDGQGNNADPDDDGDGRPDEDDDHPYDPDRQDQDTDGDGVRDKDDKFPTNPNESADADGDGVGDNIDPDDNSPPKPPGETDGDGTGGPGTGDGGGGPGPKPKPGDNGTDVVATKPGDTSGEVKVTSGMQAAPGVGASIGPAIGDKLGQFKPLGTSSIGKVSLVTKTINMGPFGTHTMDFDFNQMPWPGIRIALLCAVIYFVGREAIETLKV